MSGERGTASIMIVGFAVVAIMMVGVVVDASAAYLRRSGLDSLADGAALAAADGVQGRQVYEGGLGERAEIDAEAARAYVAGYLRATGAARRYPGLVCRVETGTDRVVVHLSRTARPADHPAGLGTPADDLRDRRVLRRGQRLTPPARRPGERKVNRSSSSVFHGIGAGQSLAVGRSGWRKPRRTDEREVRLLCRPPPSA